MEPESDNGAAGSLPAAMTRAGEASPPRTLGRYVILYALHRSAAAEVYAAYDPELDRKLAIKLLSGKQRSGPVYELAQQAHPHLVTVHDVGTFDQRVFIAMEFMAGGPLSAWLAQRVHPWQEILRRFLDAGAGLLAAHAQGLSHLGFTADAVLLDADGRARVLGFYRPPDAESHAGAVREDRNAFSRALRCALSPASGATTAPSGWLAGVPMSLRRLLQAPSAGRRRPSTELAALLRALQPRAHKTSLVAILLLAVGTISAGALYQQKQAALCRGADRQLTHLFDQARAQAIHRAFLQTGKPYAEDAFAGVQRTMATYLPRWASLYEQACQDTQRRRLPEAVQDLRMACLEQQRARLDSLFAVFTKADASVVQRAVALMYELAGPTSLDSCSDVAGLRAPPPPTDRATAAAVAAIRQDLARTDALYHAGRYQDGLRLVTQTSARSIALPYRPIHAEAFLQEGVLRMKLAELAVAKEFLLRAIWAAEASHHDRVTAQAWLYLLSIAGDREQHLREGHEYARHAAAAIERCIGCEDLWATWHDRMGTLLYAEGLLPEALSQAKEAMAQRQQRLPATILELASSYNDVGVIYGSMEQPAAAQELLQKSLAIIEHEYGPWHPQVAACLHNIALQQRDQGQLAEALRTSERALRILEQAEDFEHASGKRHPIIGQILRLIGSILIKLERYQQAQERLTQALALVESERGPDHPVVAYILLNLGEVALRLHRPAQAREHFAAALAIGQKMLPPQHPDLAFFLVGLGRALIDLSQTRQALPLLQRALHISAANPPIVSLLSAVQFALARVRWSEPATRKEAHELAEQALAGYATLGVGLDQERAQVALWLRGHPLPR